MSGICGLIHKDEQKMVDQSCLEEMTEALAIRPDQRSHTYVSGAAAFGIVSSSNEAHISSNEDLITTYDGEIYNKREIVASLDQIESLSTGFKEAEICARLYRNHGAEFVNKIRGIFSVAIWDNRTRTLFLATDPFAIKTIIYYNDDSHFIFGSKIRSILRSNLVKKELEPSSLLNYFYFSMVPTPYTIYKNIMKLPPGHFLILRNARIEIHQYWDMRYPEAVEIGKEEYWASKTLERMREAVQLYLHYDEGEVGAFLSGGTDSSTISGLVKGLNGGVKTFSIGFSEKSFNEMNYARIAAKHFKAEHYEYFVTADDAFTLIPTIIRFYNEPFGNASVIPSYFCAKFAKDAGVSALLAGDGGDEIFAGNERYLTDKIFSIYQSIPRQVRSEVLEPLLFRFPTGFPVLNKIVKYIHRSNIPNPKRFFSYNLLEHLGVRNIFESNFLEQVNGQKDYWNIINTYYEQAQAKNDLNRLLYLDLKLTISDDDLVKVNGAAELAGMRVRYPLLHRDLVEFTGTIPANLKLKHFEKRYIFKRAVRDLLPEEIIKKKKHGFGLPISVWLKKDRRFNELAKDTLLSNKTIQRGYFRKDFLESLFERLHDDQSSFYGDILWLFLVQELWHKEYYDG